MLTQKIEWLLHCCRRGTALDGRPGGELVLSTDDVQKTHQYLAPRTDSFDVTFTPNRGTSRSSAMTPRQRDLWTKLELPQLQQYPLPPGMSAEDPVETRLQCLLELYQEFVLEMHTGTYLTQLTSSRDYSDIHCQLMEDLTTLKLDQSNGRIIEFPLSGVSKVYRIVKNDDKWYSAGNSMNGNVMPLSATEHIVVVEFMRRKLAFVFGDITVSQRFLICMELLIRRAQQMQVGRVIRTLTPSFPPPENGPNRPCVTPRTVNLGEGRCG